MAFIQTTGWSFLNTITAVSWLLAKQTSLVHAVLHIFIVFCSFEFAREYFFINYYHLNSMKHNVACYMFSARWLRMQCVHLVLSLSVNLYKFKREFPIAWSNQAQISSVFWASKRTFLLVFFFLLLLENHHGSWSIRVLNTKENRRILHFNNASHSTIRYIKIKCFFLSKWWKMFTLK